MAKGSGDIEAGNNGQLYPGMTESPQLRWAFIRKVYAIVSMQLFLTAAVAAVVVFVRPIPNYLVSTTPGLAIYIIVVISPFIIMCPLFAYRQRHPVNLILLALFTVAIAFAVGMTCAFVKGSMVLMVFILIQIFIPLGKLSVMLIGFALAILFCGYIIYDTDNLIKRFSYDEYIAAAASLYLDIINLFVALLTIFSGADN
ncbi:hypothetical protein Nepgr_021828 [Nepenthes gracilis]|uniref:BI1-like protein n=1 Tax=Nepenthes gracilis TaxID=150966 RepID=A0AAD3SZN3_NEPGR|nr:hypothetical protein Nepgr_021828 [Nepenthes gracilis]